MRPILLTLPGGVPVPAYATFVTLGMLCGWAIRRAEVRRLGYTRTPGHEFVGLGALVGAMVGSKLGMVLFAADLAALWRAALDWDFTGKTVVGGIGGAYLGVELTKRIVGVTHSTGDGFAVSVPVAQAFGRVGCFLYGCCPGVPSQSGWAIGGRLPQQLYEAGADLGLAAALWTLRRGPRPAGWLFRYYLAGYASIRFVLEFVRDDVGPRWLLTPVQWVCAATVVTVGVARMRRPTDPAACAPPPARPSCSS